MFLILSFLGHYCFWEAEETFAEQTHRKQLKYEKQKRSAPFTFCVDKFNFQDSIDTIFLDAYSPNVPDNSNLQQEDARKSKG